MKINIKYSETAKQVLSIVFIPLIYCGLFLLLVSNIFNSNLPEMIIVVLLFVGIILMILLSVLTIKKYMMVDAEMDYNVQGIHFLLPQNSFIFPHHDIFINYGNIKNASIDNDESGRIFANIKTKSPGKSIFVLPKDSSDDDNFVSFWSGLESQISNFNSTNHNHTEILIKNVGFYQSRYMKVSAIFFFILAILFTGLKIIKPDEISTWKLILFYCYVLPFTLIVFNSNKKSNVK